MQEMAGDLECVCLLSKRLAPEVRKAENVHTVQRSHCSLGQREMRGEYALLLEG